MLAASAGSAGAATLTSQVPTGSFTVPTVLSFDAPAAAAKSQAADDFTVGEGQVWTVTGVDVFGLAQAGSGTDTAKVTIYSDAGAAPGSSLLSQAGIGLTGGGTCSAGNSCNFTAPVANSPGLEPGTYWLSVQAAGPVAWRWAVTPPGTTYGAPAVWQNPGNAFGTGCTTYSPLLDCGALIAADDGRDLIYRLNGTLADSRFTLGSFSTEGRRVFLEASFPDSGSAKIKGKKVKQQTKGISAAGQRSLKLKLTKGAKRKLGQGKNVKLNVKVTFTATGGVPFTQGAKVKLIPVRPVVGDARPTLRIGR
jgi:hypothetical protein